jgi:hypothetical protein
MTVVELIRFNPVLFTPNIRIGTWGVWFLDERWRLRYRLYDWKRYTVGGGFAIMVLGACISVSRLTDA